MLSQPSVPSLALAVFVLLGCGGADRADGGMDASADAGRDAASIDAPAPICAPGCGPAEVCCAFGAATECLDLRNDPNHCGECSVDCVRENRGDGCAASTCTCGAATLGCSGMREDFCCPARDAAGAPYCANLQASAADCGGCDVRCDPRQADRCSGGACRCGDGRDACAGTAESRCCQMGVDVACVDTTTDRFHCGRCDNLCSAGERCESSVCTSGVMCPAGCALGQICCDGTCCSRDSCRAGTCGIGAPDGGMRDGGAPDAGVDDAGVDDAGVDDAGVDDAGAADSGLADAG